MKRSILILSVMGILLSGCGYSESKTEVKEQATKTTNVKEESEAKKKFNAKIERLIKISEQSEIKKEILGEKYLTKEELKSRKK